MRSMKFTAALAAIAALLLLAACGGGGGSSTSSGSSTRPPPPPPGQQALTPAGTADAAMTQTAVGAAGGADPQYGSIYQQVSTETGDAPAATFDPDTGRVELTVGTTVDLNSEDHRLSVAGLESPIAGHTARALGMADRKTTADTISLSGAAVLVSWDSEDTADWLAAGYWLHTVFNRENEEVTSVAAGAFVDGPEFEDRTSMPNSGTATYSGVAGGIYAYGNPSGDVEVGEALGTVELTADFSGPGSISGSINGIGDGVAITLESTTFAQTGQINPGNVDLEVNGETFDNAGKWGGRFSSVDDNGQPRRVAGTAGAQWTESGGNRGAFVGAFVADKQKE